MEVKIDAVYRDKNFPQNPYCIKKKDGLENISK